MFSFEDLKVKHVTSRHICSSLFFNSGRGWGLDTFLFPLDIYVWFGHWRGRYSFYSIFIRHLLLSGIIKKWWLHQILTKFQSNFIQILFKFQSNLIQISFKSHSNLIQISRARNETFVICQLNLIPNQIRMHFLCIGKTPRKLKLKLRFTVN